jgi:spermidine synthase
VCSSPTTPRNDSHFQVIEGDAAEFVAGCRDYYDVILMDAFDRHGLAPSLCGRESYEDLRTRLLPGGILVANIAGIREERAGYLDTMKSVFGDNMLVLPVQEDDNDIAFAFREPAFEPRWRWIDSQVEAMHRRYGLEFPRFARKLKRSRHLSWSSRSVGRWGPT